jgi:hypothetical protein
MSTINSLENWISFLARYSRFLVDPLMCPKCHGRIKIIAFVEDEEVIEKTLKHLELWDMKTSLPPRAKTPSVTIHLDVSDSQISFPDFLYADPDYPTGSYLS